MPPTTATTRRRAGVSAWRRPTLLTAVSLGLVLALNPAAGQATAPSIPPPTIVLVHGAFADASGWQGVTTRLQKQGYTVLAPANPLRGVASDSAHLRSVLATIDGPIVLAGHSYGGEVMTNAATGNPQVEALVYVAAFAPAEGETAGELTAMFPGSQLTEENLVVRPYPISDTEVGYDAYIAPERFRAIFCADVDARTAAFMAAAQRPGSVSTLREHSGVPAWLTVPSWYSWRPRTTPSPLRHNGSWPSGWARRRARCGPRTSR